MRKKLLILSSLLIPLCTSAQDSLRVTTLREVVISATRSEQPVIETPRSVTVIDRDVIEKSIYQSVGDLLNTQAGLYVVGAGQTPGTNQNVFMRGANSNQVAVLIDGVRITDPSTPNSAIDLSEISLANVDRIEVIRGAHSTMYGGAAIGGVINIITKKGSPGVHGAASWQGGVFGRHAWLSTENVSAGYGMANGFYFDGSLFREDVRGLDASRKSDAVFSYSSDRDDFRKMDAALKGGFKNERVHSALSFKRTYQYTEIDNGPFSDDDNNYLTFDRNLLQYQAGYAFSGLFSLSLVGSFSGSERFYENDSSKTSVSTFDKMYSRGTYSGRLQTHEAQANFARGNIKGVLGAGLYGEKMSFDNYFFFNDPSFPFELRTNYDTLNPRTTTTYVFTQIGFTRGNFSISAGTRFSRHTEAGSFVTYEVNPSFAFKDILIYASLSSAFNAPSLYQLYDPSKPYLAYTTRGNVSLEPESSLSVEAGVKKEFSSGSYITLSVYQTRLKNAIEYVYLWDGSTPAEDLEYFHSRGDTYINAGDQLVSGIEVDGYVQVSRRFFAKGTVSALETKIDVAPSDINTNHTGGHHVQLYNLGTFLDGGVEEHGLVRRPGFTAFAELSYKAHSRLTLMTAYRYTGSRLDASYDFTLGPYGALARRGVDGYHLVDAGLSWQATKILAVALRAENILNQDYQEVIGFNTRGRSLLMKVTARW